MGGWLTGLGAGAQGFLGQRAANQEAGFKAQNFALDQATTRIQQQNALLEQQKFEQATKDAQAKQAAMEAIRQKNIQIPVGNGQSINLADAFAMGLGPKDFAPQPQSLKFETRMVDGKPHRFSHDQNAPNSGWQDDGEAPPAQGATSPVQKYADTPIGNLPGGSVALDSSGKPFDNPMAPLGSVISGGGGVYSPKNADLIQKSFNTEEDLKGLLSAGEVVLPKNVPTGAGEMIRDTMFNPAARYLRAKVDPKYSDFEHAKAGIIGYMRDLTGVGRVNQTEMNLVIDRLNNAQTYPALKSAVERATKIIQQGRQGMMRAGKIDPTGGVSAAPSEAWSEPELRRGPDGKPRMTRHNGSEWQWQDPSGAWVPMNG
jgi:hypothetical protein